jgi:hypothetical protein
MTKLPIDDSPPGSWKKEIELRELQGRPIEFPDRAPDWQGWIADGRRLLRATGPDAKQYKDKPLLRAMLEVLQEVTK